MVPHTYTDSAACRVIFIKIPTRKRKSRLKNHFSIGKMYSSYQEKFATKMKNIRTRAVLDNPIKTNVTTYMIFDKLIFLIVEPCKSNSWAKSLTGNGSIGCKTISLWANLESFTLSQQNKFGKVVSETTVTKGTFSNRPIL